MMYFLSCGDVMLQVLAKKMTVLYKLAREQLSKQHHYDFGLRALKSVLVMAGALKRGAPDMSEALVLMRALRDSNLPKFVYDDVPLFLGLVGDLFPGVHQYDIVQWLSACACMLKCTVSLLCVLATSIAIEVLPAPFIRVESLSILRSTIIHKRVATTSL
jgi:hypothetical protein